MAVHKVIKPGDGVPKEPRRVRRIGMRPGAEPSQQRVRELVDFGLFAPSAAETYTADPTKDRLPTKQTT